jgi:ribosomal protein S18 acetylase RimI-like enzyme
LAVLLTLNAALDAHDAFSRARLRYLLHHSTVLLGFSAGEPAGLCIIVKRGPSVHAIAVRPEFRRRGVGTLLLKAALKRFAKLRCEIRASNVASEQLFICAGFRFKGIKPNVYADGEAALEFQSL